MCVGEGGLGAAPFLWHGLQQRRMDDLGHGRHSASLSDGKKNIFEEEKKMKNSAICVRTRMVNMNTFSTTSIICLEIEITV